MSGRYKETVSQGKTEIVSWVSPPFLLLQSAIKAIYPGSTLNCSVVYSTHLLGQRISQLPTLIVLMASIANFLQLYIEAIFLPSVDSFLRNDNEQRYINTNSLHGLAGALCPNEVSVYSTV